MLSTDSVGAATSDSAWLQAMLDFEAALAATEAEVGLVPGSAAQEIAAACQASLFDADALGSAARDSANPVVALVASLRKQVPESAASWVHWGATSQDALDTAFALVVKRSGALVLSELGEAISSAASLAVAHRGTIEPGRTLLQQALPVTFGLKAAGWLVGLLRSGERLAAVLDSRMCLQLGGAAGTLASLGERAVFVHSRMAERLGLTEPALPWHTDRSSVAELGCALAVVSGAAAKAALDIELLAQTEVGEVAEAAGAARGGSSTLPQKQNPVAAVAVRACAHRAAGLASVLLFGMEQEHERAAGAWQAEWKTVTDLLRCASGAAGGIGTALRTLEVDATRMLQNLDLTGGALMSERISLRLSPALGRAGAQEAVRMAALQAQAPGTTMRQAIEALPEVAAELGAEELDELFDPSGYLGASGRFVDRAVELYRNAAMEWRWLS